MKILNQNNISSIKSGSIRSVFNYIAEHSQASRSEISKGTGLSLMTVGKIVDSFVSTGILYQLKEIKSATGRKAGRVSFDLSRYAVVIDLSADNFELAVFDLYIGLIDRYTYEYNPDYYRNENLLIFLKGASISIMNKLDPFLCIGTGIITKINDKSDIYVINEVLPDFPVSFSETKMNSAVISQLSRIPNHESKKIYYLNLNENSASGAFIYSGNMYESFPEKLMLEYASPNKILKIAYVIKSISVLLSPDTVIIESQDEYFRNILESSLYTSLKENCRLPESDIPEFILNTGDSRHSQCGIVIKLRELWVNEIIS